MTIKQQGGIFGRNPTFNDVDLDGDLNVSGSSTLDGNTLLNGKLGLNVASPTYLLEMYDTTNDGEVRIGSDNLANQGTVASILFAGRNFSGQKTDYAIIDTEIVDRNTGSEDGRIIFKTMRAGVMTEAGRFDNFGNLAFPSGQGIDFSATSGTGTSELFDDYEEGTWTPSVAAGAISGTSITYSGSYTKVGNKVTVTFKANNTAGDIQISSYAVISGLPFTASSSEGGSSTITTEDIDQFSRQGFAAVGNNSSNLALSAAGSATGTVKLQVSLTYLT